MASPSDSTTPSARCHFIYAIMLPNTPQIHVAHTVVPKVSKFFNKQMSGRVGATASMARHAANEGRHLSLYLLETYDTNSDVDAYHRCIAWQMLASQAGLSPQSAADRAHLAHPNSTEQAHYAALRHRDILALCAPEHDLTPGILARQRGPRSNSSHRSVRVTMPSKTHASLSKTARCHGRTLPEHLIICATNASPGVDLSEIIAVRSEIQQALALLRSTVVRPELTPGEIQRLFDASRTISSALSTVTECLTSITSKH